MPLATSIENESQRPLGAFAGFGLAARNVSAQPGSFRFSISPTPTSSLKLKAAKAARLLRRINARSRLRPLRRDLVFDPNPSTGARQYCLQPLRRNRQTLEMKVHSVPAITTWSAFPHKRHRRRRPHVRKRYFEDKVGPRYSSFDHKGWHFILLDSIASHPTIRSSVESTMRNCSG